MLNPLTYARQARQRSIRRRLDENCGQIIRALGMNPWDVDGREALWIRRFQLLRRLT